MWAARNTQIELFIEDNAGKADQSASAAQKLITQDNVVAIIGPNASRYAIPASEIAESNKVVLISPWSTNPKITLDANTGAPKKYVFRACFIDPFQGRVVAKFALDQLRPPRPPCCTMWPPTTTRASPSSSRRPSKRTAAQVVAFETYTTSDKDFNAQLTKIKEASPEVIFLPNYYSEVPLQIQQAHGLGITVPFLGSDSWGSSELLTLCGADCEGYYFSTHYAADNATPVAKKFIDAYKANTAHTPDDVAALTYDAFGLLWQALQTAGKVDRQAVRDALAKIPSYEGVTGNMQFQEGSGDPIKSAVILQIKDGNSSGLLTPIPKLYRSILLYSRRHRLSSLREVLYSKGSVMTYFLQQSLECLAIGQHLCADRPGLYHGVWHPDHDQFRPWRLFMVGAFFCFIVATFLLT